MENLKRKIVSDEGFINSIRDLGLTTINAINELVDNSFDANAENVWITIGRNNGSLFLIIEDDGDGIPKNELQNVLSFGGRLSFRNNTTGKFGWGLSSSACCQSPRTEVYSKVQEEDNFYFNYIDLKELKSKKGFLPETSYKNPFDTYHLNLCKDAVSGTIVILTVLDRPDFKKEDVLVSKVHHDISIVHRRLLANGKKISINGSEIKFKDPLMLMDGFDGIDETGKGEDYADIKPIIFKNIKDHNGNPAKVEIKVSKLPVKTIKNKKLQEKFDIGVRDQGFYLMRNNRQIAGGLTFYLYARHPSYNYFRSEISFPPSLDKIFGIQTNKSRFALDDDLRQKLEEKLSKVLTQIVKDIKDESDTIDVENNKGSEIERPISEEIAEKAAKRLKPSGYRPSKEKDVKDRIDLEKEKNDLITKISTKSELSKNEKEKLIRKIEIAFQSDRTFKRVIDVIGTGEFYDIKHKGNRIEVIINQAHGFYKKIYEKATQDPNLQLHLDLFLYTLATAEDIYFDNQDVRDFYKSQKREWSTIMSTFLDESDKEIEN